MTQKNGYFRRSKISEARFRARMRCFALDLTATTTAELTGLSVRSVNAIFLGIHPRMAEECERHSPFTGEVEVDESFFGPWRVRGKRGCGAYKKTIVFGMLKRGERVYTQVVPNCRAVTPQAVIRGHIALDSTILSTACPAMTAWSIWGTPSTCASVTATIAKPKVPTTINGIESFWSYAKHRLAKFNAQSTQTFHLHLKECELRFNHRHGDLYQATLKLLRAHPLRARLLPKTQKQEGRRGNRRPSCLHGAPGVSHM